MASETDKLLPSQPWHRYYSTLLMTATCERYLESGSRQTLRELMHHLHNGSFCPLLDLFQSFFAMAVEIIDSVEAGTLSAEMAAARLFDLIAAADFIPPVFLLASTRSHLN